MTLKLELIALVPNGTENTNDYTVYFLEKEKSVVVPIGVSRHDAHEILLITNPYTTKQPNIHSSLIHLVTFCNGQIENIEFYKYADGLFYTYLNLKIEGKEIQLNIKPTDAINIARRCNKPILIDEEVLDISGIKITAETLREALEYYS